MKILASLFSLLNIFLVTQYSYAQETKCEHIVSSILTRLKLGTFSNSPIGPIPARGDDSPMAFGDNGHNPELDNRKVFGSNLAEPKVTAYYSGKVMKYIEDEEGTAITLDDNCNIKELRFFAYGTMTEQECRDVIADDASVKKILAACAKLKSQAASNICLSPLYDNDNLPINDAATAYPSYRRILKGCSTYIGYFPISKKGSTLGKDGQTNHAPGRRAQ
jgi:hypothetical protein